MNKLGRLKDILKDYKRVIVAYSGGVDSTFLLKAAIDSLGKENVLAVVAVSETYPEFELHDAKASAILLDANIRVINTNEFEDPNFRSNPKDRCYFCKKELFIKLIELAGQLNFNYVIDGSNSDDLSDFRPGALAKKELKIKSPLQEAGLTKQEIRQISKTLKLPTWDKPSYACLASRIPYGTEITKDILKRIDRGESYLRELGFSQLRVRHHGDLVRIEVEKESIQKILTDEVMDGISEKFKELGYIYITVDLQGYRIGSMNEALDEKNISG